MVIKVKKPINPKPCTVRAFLLKNNYKFQSLFRRIAILQELQHHFKAQNSADHPNSVAGCLFFLYQSAILMRTPSNLPVIRHIT